MRKGGRSCEKGGRHPFSPLQGKGVSLTSRAERLHTLAPASSESEVLTRTEVAAWLKVKPRQVERLGVPCIALGRKTVRYLRADVLTWLQQQRRTA